jgi:hypothetical protein
MHSLNPTISIGDLRLALATQFMATVRISSLKGRLGSLAHERDAITRAIDALLSGI